MLFSWRGLRLMRRRKGEGLFFFFSSYAFAAPPQQPQRRVVVTGMGAVTPLACGVEASWRRLVEGKTGVRALSIEDLRVYKLLTEDDHLDQILHQLTSRVIATVPHGSQPGDFDSGKWLQGKGSSAISPFIAYALCAAEEALIDARWFPHDSDSRERTGVAIGGGIGCIREIMGASLLVAQKRVRELSPFFVPRILINMAAGHVSIKYGFKGPNHAAVTACASGTHSIGDAFRMVRFGDADVMVAGGAESSIDALSIAGFSRAKALSTKFNSDPEKASRPFDSQRDGFVIGEGAGILVLEELQHAIDRGAKIYAEVRGYGMSGDAHHITRPPNDGKGAILAMSRALNQAGLCPEEVDYVNAHATSTPLGDKVEASAILSLFKNHALSGDLLLSSTKGATGHLLGAAGAVEAIFSVLALSKGVSPPTLNIEKPDAVFHGNFSPLTSPKEQTLRAVLSNSFGFGGTNACLVFSCPP